MRAPRPEFSIPALAEAYGLGSIRAVLPLDKDPVHLNQAEGQAHTVDRGVRVWTVITADDRRLVVKHFGPRSRRTGLTSTDTAKCVRQERARAGGVRTPVVMLDRRDELAVVVPDARTSEIVHAVCVQEFVDNAGWPPVINRIEAQAVARAVGGLLTSIHAEAGDKESAPLVVSAHGDFRPANLLFDSRGDIWVIDFLKYENVFARSELARLVGVFAHPTLVGGSAHGAEPAFGSRRV